MLDVFRIAPRTLIEPKAPVCLLVGVEPVSISFDEAERISLNCEKFLIHHDLYNVRCFMQESTVSQLVTQPTGQYQMPYHGRLNSISPPVPGKIPLEIHDPEEMETRFKTQMA